MSKEKEIIKPEKGVVRRDFFKIALKSSTALGLAAMAPSLAKASEKTASVKVVDKGDAESIYKCKNLERWKLKNFAFKKLSEEDGTPWYLAYGAQNDKNFKAGSIGDGPKAKNRHDFRAFHAMRRGSETWDGIAGGSGKENIGLMSWNPLNIPEHIYNNPESNPDPKDMAKKIKVMAKLFGADRVGIAPLNQKWVLNETCRNANGEKTAESKPIVFRDVKHPKETDSELIIPKTVNRAVVFILEMNREAMSISPNTEATMMASSWGYSRMAVLDIAFAEAIRAMGYNAIPCKNQTALSIPLAIDAGLGQLGRNGLLVTPDFGPNVRICKVLTDMPLATDKPIDFGVTEFCEWCKKCADMCPSQSISLGERTYDPLVPTGWPGAYKWYINGKSCLRYWMKTGTECGSCMAVCPYTKGSAFVHDIVKAASENLPFLNPVMRDLDDMFGYGKPFNPDRFWDLDMAPYGIDKNKI